MSDVSRTKDHEVDSNDGVINRSPGAVRSKTEGGGASIVQVELGLGKSALAVLWISALISGLAVAGLIGTMLFIRANIGYTAVLEYDLMDLRAKVGEAHENTPEVDE